jgi:hypothetical protein
MRRSSRGIYPGQQGIGNNLIDSGFTLRETELLATWIVSGKSVLTGRLTRIERKYDHFTQFNFSGTNGEFRYAWQPTEKLTLDVSAIRTIAPFLQTTSSHRVDNTLAIAPVWQVTSKVSLNMIASRIVTDYLGQGTVAAPSRRDTALRSSLGANWAAHPKITLSANLAHEARTSNVPGLDYRDTILGATATFAF